MTSRIRQYHKPTATVTQTAEMIQKENIVEQHLSTPETPKDEIVLNNPQSSTGRAAFMRKAAPKTLPAGGFLKQEDKARAFQEFLSGFHKNFEGVSIADAERVLNAAEEFLVSNSEKYEFNVHGTKFKRTQIKGRFYSNELMKGSIVYVPEHEVSNLRIEHKTSENINIVIADDGSFEMGFIDAHGNFVADEAITTKYADSFMSWYDNLTS